MQSQFSVGSLGLSGKSTRQLERLIDDSAWVTYPLHLMVGVVKTFLFLVLLVGAVMLYTGEWMFTAHNDRADLIQNFTREQTIYRFDTASATISVAKAGEFAVDRSTFDSMFTGCAGTDSSLKHTTWFDHNWLTEKSDVFQAAYIVSAHNVAALRFALSQIKSNSTIESFRYACLDAVIYGQGVLIPNAPVVTVAFLRRTDRDLESPANAKYNYFTGMCLASANCTSADYSPRNSNIYADAIRPQVTENQAAALKALAETGSPEFWIATAHANGIYGHDDAVRQYALMNQRELATVMKHQPTPEEDFIHEAELAIGCGLLFICIIGVWIVHRTGKSVHPA